MNVSKTEKYRYCLFFLLEDLAEEANFSPESLHITVLPWFVVEPDIEVSLLHSFKAHFSNLDTFEVTIADAVSLGPREDISVLLVEPYQQLFELHKYALDWFEQLAARWAVKNPYVDQEYKPHIRRRENIQLKRGDSINFNSLCLVRALRRADDFRLIHGKVIFNE